MDTNGHKEGSISEQDPRGEQVTANLLGRNRINSLSMVTVVFGSLCSGIRKLIYIPETYIRKLIQLHSETYILRKLIFYN